MKTRIGLFSVSCVLLLMAAGISAGETFSDRGLRPAACIITHPELTRLGDVAGALEGSGVQGLQIFGPDVIVGHFPAHVEASVFEGMHVEMVTSPEDVRLAGLDPLVRRSVRTLMREEQIAREAMAAGATLEPFTDLVFEVPDEVARQWKYEGPLKGSPSEIVQRGVRQNSELLIGTVLVNIIFPESDGSGEDWTDDEMAAAISSISLGFSQYQQHALWLDPLKLTFIQSHYVRIPVSMEPIMGDWNSDPIWITEAMQEIDPSYYHDATWATHQHNNATREAYKRDHGVTVDWVLTAFVVDASANYCWQGPAGGYAAYAYLGGPYMVTCYPPCRFVEHEFGFSHVFIHEMSHIFWALDEYASAETPCGATSGYMNVPNRNTRYNPCQPLVDCIMNNAELEMPLPICDYTLGQVGLWDENNNSTVDVYEIPPEVEISIPQGYTDTLIAGGNYPVYIEITNPARKNMNPNQDPDMRIDYAPWIISAIYALNDNPFRALSPSDGKWDMSVEKCGILEMPGFMPGKNILRVRAENCVRTTGGGEKEYYYIGIKYYQTSGQVSQDHIDLSWTTTGEVFGSVFDVVREDRSTGSPAAVLGIVSEPDMVGDNKNYYTYRDDDIVAGHEYVYHVVARFRLGVAGEVQDFAFASGEIAATAMIPVTSELLSYIVPNPTSSRCTFTLDVPTSYYDPSASRGMESLRSRSSTSLLEVKTPVDVRIYNVNGEHIRTIYSRERYSGAMTLAWDGLDKNGRKVVPGVYFLHVQAGGKKDMRKIVVIR